MDEIPDQPQVEKPPVKTSPTRQRVGQVIAGLNKIKTDSAEVAKKAGKVAKEAALIALGQSNLPGEYMERSFQKYEAAQAVKSKQREEQNKARREAAVEDLKRQAEVRAQLKDDIKGGVEKVASQAKKIYKLELTPEEREERRVKRAIAEEAQKKRIDEVWGNYSSLSWREVLGINRDLTERLKLFTPNFHSSYQGEKPTAQAERMRFSPEDQLLLTALEQHQLLGFGMEETKKLLENLKKENAFKGIAHRAIEREGTVDSEVRKRWQKAGRDFLEAPMSPNLEKFIKGGNSAHLMSRGGREREEFGREIEIDSNKKRELIEEFETEPRWKNFEALVANVINEDYHNLDKLKANPLSPEELETLEVLAAARGTRFFTDLHEHLYQAINSARLVNDYLQSGENVPVRFVPGSVIEGQANMPPVSYKVYREELARRLLLHSPENEKRARENIRKRTPGKGPKFLWWLTALREKTRRNNELTQEMKFNPEDAKLLAILSAVNTEERINKKFPTWEDPNAGILKPEQRTVLAQLKQLQRINSPEQKVAKADMKAAQKALEENPEFMDKEKRAGLIQRWGETLAKNEGWFDGAATMLSILHGIMLQRQLGETSEQLDLVKGEQALLQDLLIRKEQNTGSLRNRFKNWQAQRRNKQRTPESNQSEVNRAAGTQPPPEQPPSPQPAAPEPPQVPQPTPAEQQLAARVLAAKENATLVEKQTRANDARRRADAAAAAEQELRRRYEEQQRSKGQQNQQP